MMFGRRKAEPLNDVPLFRIAFRVTDSEGHPVDADLLDQQTDLLAEYLQNAGSHLFRDLDVDATLGEGTVSFSVEVLEAEPNMHLLVKEMLSSIVPAIQSAGGTVALDELSEPPALLEPHVPVWHPEEPVLA